MPALLTSVSIRPRMAAGAFGDLVDVFQIGDIEREGQPASTGCLDLLKGFCGPVEPAR